MWFRHITNSTQGPAGETWGYWHSLKKNCRRRVVVLVLLRYARTILLLRFRSSLIFWDFCFRGRLHESGLTGNPGSYINPGYKKVTFTWTRVGWYLKPIHLTRVGWYLKPIHLTRVGCYLKPIHLTRLAVVRGGFIQSWLASNICLRLNNCLKSVYLF